ncbi:unnamed protein product [Camellia sinensis]
MSSMASSTALPTLPANLGLLISNLSSFVNVKLDSTNFIIWKTQLQNILRATDLLDILDGSSSCPSPFVLDSTGKEIPNPEFSKWKMIDNHLLSCVTATLSPSIFTSVLHLKTSSEVWLTLNKRFTSLSRSHIHQLKNKLNSISKKTESMELYLSHIKELVDQLHLASASVDDEDIVLITLNGLPREYDAFKTTIRARSEGITMDELSSLLCSEALHIEEKPKSSSELSLAYAAMKDNVSSSSKGFSTYHHGRSNYRGDSRGHYRGNRSGGRYSSSSRGRYQSKNHNHIRSPFGSVCQICGKPNHSAFECWHRMDPHFQQSTQSSPQHFPASSGSKAYTTSTSEVASQNCSLQPWYLDSAATDHITNDLDNLTTYHPYTGSEKVTVADGSSLPIHHTGSGLLPTPHHSFKLKRVLHVPSLSSNLLSVQQLAKDNNCSITFNNSAFSIQDNNTKATLHKGFHKHGLYHFPLHSSPQAFHNTTTSSDSFMLWHQRLGHPSGSKLQHLHQFLNVPLRSNKNKTSFSCIDCSMSKSHRLPFKLSTSHVNQPLALIHSDVWGPFHPVGSTSIYKYYVLFVDDYSRFTWLYPLSYKSEVYSKFLEFKSFVEKQFGFPLKILRTDGGGEFINHQMEHFIKTNGILHQQSCPHTPSQNGVAERKHRHITETAIALLHQSSLPLTYWFDAIATATFLINRLPSASLSHASPFQLLFHTSPDYSLLKVFGCLCYPWLRFASTHKLQPKSSPCVFLGYHPSIKGYRCFNLQTGHTLISRHVIFHETIFPFSTPSPTFTIPTQSTLSSFFWSSSPKSVPSQPRHLMPPSQSPLLPSQPLSTQPVSHPNHLSTQPVPSSQLPPQFQQPRLPQQSPQPTHQLQQSQQCPQPPIPINSIAIHLPLPTPSSTSNTHSMQTRSKSKLSSSLPSSSCFLTSSPVSSTEPLSYKSALTSPVWFQAMLDEYSALQMQHTWSLVPLPPHKQAIGCKWVFKLKKNSDGTVARHKARLVAKGFLQEHGIDFQDTFSPVAKQPTIRILLCLALHSNWSLKQLDISNAFLHGRLEEEVYMVQPPGFVDPSHPQLVCKLHKALYGLKQAPRAWYSTFSSFLLSQGFVMSQCDHSLFVHKTSSTITYLLIYVDDILLTGNDSVYLQSLLTHMHQAFSLKELGSLSYFLGISVTSSSLGFFLSQHKYASELLVKAGMVACKPCATPVSSKPSSSAADVLPCSNPFLYRSLIGGLQYLTITRPELAYAVNQACQFMHSPSNANFSAVKRILRYVKGTLSHGLTFSPSSFQLQAFTDSNWAGDPLDRRSTSGYCIFLGSNLISWSSKKQATVSRSSTEAEYRALAHTAAEVTWLQMLLTEFAISLPSPPIIWCDNQSALSLAANPVFHSRSKHIEVDCHFVREKVAAHQLVLRYIPTLDQLADVFTKPLSTSRFQFLTTKLLVSPPPIRLWGDDRISHNSEQPKQIQLQ